MVTKRIGILSPSIIYEDRDVTDVGDEKSRDGLIMRRKRRVHLRENCFANTHFVKSMARARRSTSRFAAATTAVLDPAERQITRDSASRMPFACKNALSEE